MNKNKLLLGLVSLLCCSCAVSSLKSVEYDPQKGTYQQIKYSPLFSGEEILVPGKLKVLVYGKLRDRLGKEAVVISDEPIQSADFAVYFSNLSETNAVFAVNSIILKKEASNEPLLNTAREFLVVPKTVERIIFDNIMIDRNDKAFKLFVSITYGRQQIVKEIELSRLTVEEAKASKESWVATFSKD